MEVIGDDNEKKCECPAGMSGVPCVAVPVTDSVFIVDENMMHARITMNMGETWTVREDPVAGVYKWNLPNELQVFITALETACATTGNPCTEA